MAMMMIDDSKSNFVKARVCASHLQAAEIGRVAAAPFRWYRTVVTACGSSSRRLTYAPGLCRLIASGLGQALTTQHTPRSCPAASHTDHVHAQSQAHQWPRVNREPAQACHGTIGPGRASRAGRQWHAHAVWPRCEWPGTWPAASGLQAVDDWAAR